jgi:C-terminal processing protease CtpA/Prc
VLRILSIFFVLLCFHPFSLALAQAPASTSLQKTSEPQKPKSTHDEYLAYFEEVYKTMDANYYFDIQRSDFDRFLKVFEDKIYKNLLLEGKSSDYVRWRSAAYLVDYLKQPDDIFSRFLPPKPAEKFAQEVYGEKIDLGIEGRLLEPGFQVDFVEPRSDAFELGLRENDLILRINELEVAKLGEAKVKELLVPLKGVKVKIDYLDAAERRPHEITPES